MHFVATSIMAVSSLSHYAKQTWDTSVSSLSQPANPFESHILNFAMAYMLADFVFMAFFVRNVSWRDRAMYVVHHAAAASCMGQALHTGKYGRLMFFSLTCEVSNIFLNGRELIPSRAAYVFVFCRGTGK
jgi:hypothetical protein